ncbi:glycosyltransferase, partial [Dehalococcoidia bacterium]|nr:glycosyltransferase [Dehalococcoidia bacterium]
MTDKESFENISEAEGLGPAPEVSIVINCLNGERHLRETLDSALAQTLDDWEIIFWDNASTDRTAEIATSYGEKVRYFRSESTTPLSQARSWAFEKARGKYIAILDSDDIWLPQKLERQVELFESNAELGLVYCDSLMFDSGGDRYSLFQGGSPKRGHVFGDLLARNFMFTSTMMFRRSALQQLDHVFDVSFTRVQDYELTLRVAYHFPIDYVDEPLCKWRMFQDSPEWQKWKNSLIPRVFEVKAAVEKIIERYPDIKDNYSTAVAAFYNRMDYGFGVTSWQLGKPSEARQYLSRHLNQKKFAFVYLCTFFVSYSMFDRMK